MVKRPHPPSRNRGSQRHVDAPRQSEQLSAEGVQTMRGVKDAAAPSLIHDERLSECVWRQWELGDWDSLAQLDRETLRCHPDRARLALLVAAGCVQTNQVSEGRRFIHLAQDWGVSRTLVARVLAASVHNSLGRAAAIAGNASRALMHFEDAVSIGVPAPDLQRVTAARVSNQLKPLGTAVSCFFRILLKAREKARRNGCDRNDESAAQSSCQRLESPSIVIAGMRHSGSTALFNIIRLALEQAGVPFSSGYSENPVHQKELALAKGLKLIKTHEFRDDVARAENLIITTRRDLRDSVASAKRRGFPLMDRVGGETEYAKYNRALHDIWLPYSDFVFDYERFMQAPAEEIRKVLDCLGLDMASAEKIHRTVNDLPTDQYQKTLLSPTHITDPEHCRSYRDTLSSEVIEKINNDHAVWLARYGYE